MHTTAVMQLLIVVEYRRVSTRNIFLKKKKKSKKHLHKTSGDTLVQIYVCMRVAIEVIYIFY